MRRNGGVFEGEHEPAEVDSDEEDEKDVEEEADMTQSRSVCLNS